MADGVQTLSPEPTGAPSSHASISMGAANAEVAS